MNREKAALVREFAKQSTMSIAEITIALDKFIDNLEGARTPRKRAEFVHGKELVRPVAKAVYKAMIDRSEHFAPGGLLHGASTIWADVKHNPNGDIKNISIGFEPDKKLTDDQVTQFKDKKTFGRMIRSMKARGYSVSVKSVRNTNVLFEIGFLRP